MTLSLFHSPLFKQLRTFKRSARLFLLATIVDGIVYSAWGLFFNFYIIERGFDRNYLGLVNALPALAMLLLGIPLGMLSDRIGRKRAMLTGVATTMVCMALQVTLRKPELILAAAFLGGVSNSLYYLSQAPFMMKASDEHNRTLLFSMNFGLVTLAGAIGALFAGQLPGFFGGLLHVQATSAMAYRAVLLMSVALSFLTLIPLTMIREEEKRSEDKGEVKTASRPTSPWSNLKQVLRKPLTYRLALPNLMIGLGAAILIPYINVFFRERFAMPDQNLGVLFSVSAVLTGIGTIIGPRLAVNLGGKIRAVVLTQGISLAFLLVLGFSPFLWLASIGFLVRGTLMNMAVPLYSAFVMEQVAEREQGTVNSVKELAWQMGWAIGPYLSGVVQESYGFTPLFVATAILYAASIFLTWFLFKDQDAPTQAVVPFGENLEAPSLADEAAD